MDDVQQNNYTRYVAPSSETFKVCLWKRVILWLVMYELPSLFFSWKSFGGVCSYQATFWGKMMKILNYRPGWWALYFVYCAIPIGIYVCYLWKRVAEVTGSCAVYCYLLLIYAVIAR